MAAALSLPLEIFAPSRNIQRVFGFVANPTPINDRFDILDNIDGSIDAEIEVIPVSSPSTPNVFLSVTLPLAAVVIGAAWTVFVQLNGSIDSQRLEFKQDITALSSKMDENTKTVGALQGEVGKLSGEIVKAKSDVISKVSELAARQTILEKQ